MREFATFTVTYLFWLALGFALTILTFLATCLVMWNVAYYATPVFGVAQANTLGQMAGSVMAVFAFTGFVMAFLTVRSEITERKPDAANRDRAPRNPPSGGTSGQRNASSPPLPGSSRPDPRKEHNPCSIARSPPPGSTAATIGSSPASNSLNAGALRQSGRLPK